MDKISSLLYRNNISGETGSSKSRPSSAHPLHARPSSAGATRSRSSHRGSTGTTNRDRDRETLPSGVYGQVFGASSKGSSHNTPTQQQQQQQQQQPGTNAPPLLHVNSLGTHAQAHGQYQPNGMPARPRSAGAVRRPSASSGVESSNNAHNPVPSSMPAIYSPASHNTAPSHNTYEQGYQAYYQAQNNAANNANKQPNMPMSAPGTPSGARPLSAGAVPYKLLYGAQAQTQTQPMSPHNAPTQAQTLSGPPVNAVNGTSSNSSAASKLRQALDLSRHLLTHTTPSHNNDVPISALLGATHLADLNTTHNAPTQQHTTTQPAQQPTLAQQHAPTQSTQPQSTLTQLTTHDTHAHTDDEPLLGVEGALRTSEEENEEVDLDEMDGKRVSGSQHPEVSLSHSHLSHTMDLLTQPSAHTQAHTTATNGTTELRNTSIDSFPDENAINVGLSTVPNQFCTKRDALELKKLLLLSQGTRGGIVPSSSAVMDMYMVGKVVGVGSYGKVRAAWHRLTGCKVAIKTYDKAKLKDPSHWKRVHSEIKIMEQISHPRIARMYEAVETPKRMHLIMECLDGGNLCSYVKAKKRLSEDESRRIFFQILQAIEHLHALGVSHRDVKLENVLFVNDRDIKLIDFGFSTVCQPGKKLKVFCGTPSYMAPEIVRRLEYEGRPVDIWSLGILLYALLCGCFPFRAKAYPDLYRRIARGTFAIPDELSAPVKDLLRQLLTVDSEQRVTAHSALRHSWLQAQLVNAPNMDRMRKEMVVLISDQPADDIDEEVLSELSAFGMSREEIVRLVLSKTHCSLATLYYLLLDTVVSKRRLAGNKKALPSGLGNFSFNSASVNANNINNPIAGAALPHYAQPQNGVRSQSRPKTASGPSPHYSSHAYNAQQNNVYSNASGAVPLQMYVPGVMPQVVSPYETLLQQHQQQQQQTFTYTQTSAQAPTENYRPKSASGTRSSSTGTQRPLSAYAGRR